MNLTLVDYGKIYGQEKNLSTSAIARMNLFLHGAREFKIIREDTLQKPQFIQNGALQRFDCVLAIIWSRIYGVYNVHSEAPVLLSA